MCRSFFSQGNRCASSTVPSERIVPVIRYSCARPGLTSACAQRRFNSSHSCSRLAVSYGSRGPRWMNSTLPSTSNSGSDEATRRRYSLALTAAEEGRIIKKRVLAYTIHCQKHQQKVHIRGIKVRVKIKPKLLIMYPQLIFKHRL